MDNNNFKTRRYPRDIGFSSDEILGNNNYIIKKQLEKCKNIRQNINIYILTISRGRRRTISTKNVEIVLSRDIYQIYLMKCIKLKCIVLIDSIGIIDAKEEKGRD